MNPLKLPEGFAWRLTPQPAKEYAHLTFLDHETAVIRRLGQVWVAVINEEFSSVDFRACPVPDPVKGQMWLATWARSNSSLIKSVCLDEECAQPKHEWLSQGLTPLRNSI